MTATSSTNDDTTTKSRRCSLNPFKKRTKKKVFRGEEDEEIDEVIIDDEYEIKETKNKKSGFLKVLSSRGGKITSKSIGQTVVLSDADFDDEEKDFFPQGRSVKLENAESFVAKKLEQMRSTSQVKTKEIRTIDIQASESKSENDQSTKLFNSHGVMMFDGMDDEHEMENHEEEETDQEKGKNDSSQKNIPNFVKAPENYDPRESGFYQPSKKDFDDESGSEKDKEEEVEVTISNDVEESNGIWCSWR